MRRMAAVMRRERQEYMSMLTRRPRRIPRKPGRDNRMTEAKHPSRAEIQHAASVLRRGWLVAFPTETVYGLGANALDATAVSRVFEAKGRPGNNPLIVHVGGA